MEIILELSDVEVDDVETSDVELDDMELDDSMSAEAEVLLTGLELLLSGTADVDVTVLLSEDDSLVFGVFITKVQLTLTQPPPSLRLGVEPDKIVSYAPAGPAN